MATYYIHTQEGPRGPFDAETIRRGLREGRIPATARLQDSLTGNSFDAAQLPPEPGPIDSGPAVLNNPYAPRPMPAPRASYPAYTPYSDPQFAPYYPVPRQTSGMAVASLVLSLITFATCLPTCIGGIICGRLALRETIPNGPKDGRGMAQWGFGLGVALTAMYVLFIGLIVLVAVAEG